MILLKLPGEACVGAIGQLGRCDHVADAHMRHATFIKSIVVPFFNRAASTHLGSVCACECACEYGCECGCVHVTVCAYKICICMFVWMGV